MLPHSFKSYSTSFCKYTELLFLVEFGLPTMGNKEATLIWEPGLASAFL